MKPILSIAVVLIALSVLTDSASAEEEPSVGKKLEDFGAKVRDLASTFGEKTKKTFQDLHKSEFATKTRDWFADVAEKVKGAFKSN